MYAEPLDRKPSMGERYRGQRIDPGAVSVRAAMNKSFGETVSRQKPRCGAPAGGPGGLEETLQDAGMKAAQQQAAPGRGRGG